MPPESPQPIRPLERERQLKQLSLMKELLKEAKAIKETISKSKDKEEKERLTLELKEILSQCQSIKSKIEGEETKEARDTTEIEKEIESFTLFYKTHSIDLPPDFKETMLDIWNRNREEIEKEIQQNGFNTILLIPPTPSLPDLAEKMKMEKGYSFYQVQSDFSDVQSSNTDKPRIILVHKVQNLEDDPKLSKTLNITGTEAQTHNPLSLEEYIIFQRKYFEETQKHLDEVSWTWLSSKVGARLANSCWDPSDRGLNVSSDDPGDRFVGQGVRPSRCFF